jgi:hypothetical protein
MDEQPDAFSRCDPATVDFLFNGALTLRTVEHVLGYLERRVEPAVFAAARDRLDLRR